MNLIEAKTYQAFYTKSTPIISYMVDKLRLKPTDSIFEPCGGDGVFVEAIIESNDDAIIDIYELKSSSVKILEEKFSHYKNVTIKECDTVLDNDLLFRSDFGGQYDKIIANPPYGAWQDESKKVKLKKIYPHLYIKETYGLFLFRCIKLLKDEGLLTFIIPDTFLNLHMHKELRRIILNKTKIVELSLFPSSYFPGVNFGYANLSIITLQKCNDQHECLNNQFKVLTDFPNVNHLENINEAILTVYSFKQSEVMSNPDHAFLITKDKNVFKSITETGNTKIGDIADCVTGFYSGNDKEFLRTTSTEDKNLRKYKSVDKCKVSNNYLNNPDILDGIEDFNTFVPIVKGGNKRFIKPDLWYMDWSKNAVKHFKSDKRARFQNPKFYFKKGIAVPMISSSSITASLIENRLFDQSIVGIFPKDESLIYYLLAFFNSKTCNQLIRTINPSANNPSNYIKKIPFVIPSFIQLEKINFIIESILTEIDGSGTYTLGHLEKVNEIIEEVFGF